MKLHSIAYTEYEGESFAWKLDEFVLSNINLVVGKNSTGKSRLLRIINGLARLIEGSVQPTVILDGQYRAIYKDVAGSEDQRRPDLEYSLTFLNKKVTGEKLSIGGQTKLSRGAGGRAELWFEKNRAAIDVQIPEIHIAASARRDSTQHPFFEHLHEWAATVKYFEFSKTEDQIFSTRQAKIPTEVAQNISYQNNLHLVTRVAKERFGRSFEGPVITDMRSIGYDISEFGLMQDEGVSIHHALQMPGSASPQTLYVRERDIDKNLVQREISNGMQRALATIIYMNFARLNKKRDCLLIDDIGEGLDFERSTKLIALLIREAEKGFIQLILTTNDRFVMNGVPLQYWSIIQREKGKVSVFNEINSAQIFADFEQYGFNNFDFFSKGFYKTGVKVKSQ